MPNALHKYSCLHKLVVDLNINNVQQNCMNYNKDLNATKEAEEDMPVSPLREDVLDILYQLIVLKCQDHAEQVMQI